MIIAIIYSGGYIVQRLSSVLAQGSFTPKEKLTSSTYRELLAVKFVLQSVGVHLKNETVQWFSDNINVSRIIEVGSRRPHLHKLAIEIFDICMCFNIKLQPSWIPREQNETADFLSKIKDTDSWGVDNETFDFIQRNFEKFTVDRFSDDLNKKLSNFNSKYHCPNTSGVNAFTYNWSGHFNWLCPPISMIGDAIKHLKLCHARGVLFVPMWPSSYFWPLLVAESNHFNDFVKNYLLLDPYFYNYASCKSVFDLNI